MKKTIHIFIVTAIFLATTLSHVQLWKCLINGDLLLSPGCLVKVEEKTCCQESSGDHEAISDEDCCEKISCAKQLNFENIDITTTPKERKVSTSELFLISVCDSFSITKNVDFFNNLPPPDYLTKNNSPLFITLCSFLC